MKLHTETQDKIRPMLPTAGHATLTNVALTLALEIDRQRDLIDALIERLNDHEDPELVGYHYDGGIE